MSEHPMHSETPANKGHVHDGLRLGLLSLWNRRGDEGLAILSISSGVSKRKIKAFMDGDDAALSKIERTALEILQ